MDNFPEDLKTVVHDHWGQFPPQHPLIADFFGLVIFLLWCMSFLGNSCVIYIFLSERSLRTPTNMFIINLAFSDLCMITTQGLPVTISAFASDHWIYGALICQIYACLGGIFGKHCTLLMVFYKVNFDYYRNCFINDHGCHWI